MTPREQKLLGRHYPHRREQTKKHRPPFRYEVIDGVPCAWIPLTQGRWTLIEMADFPLVKDYNWFYRKDGGYACRNRLASEGPKGTLIRVHQVICPCDPGFEPDHQNGDGLDNRRSNLRPSTHNQNSKNQKMRNTNTSGFKGIHWIGRANRWCAQITVDGVNHYLGIYKEITDAIAARKEAEAKYFGEFSRKDLNAAVVHGGTIGRDGEVLG